MNFAFYIIVVGTDTLKRRQFFQYFQPPPTTPAGVRRLPEEVETEMKAVERGLGKLSYITITLVNRFFSSESEFKFMKKIIS